MLRVLLLVVMLSFTYGVQAKNDDGLYEGVAPPGSTFVRVFNANVSGAITPEVASNTLGGVSACGASDYVFLPAGKLEISVGSIKDYFDLAGDRFYTIIYNAGNLSIEEDVYFNNRRKALLSFYNQSLEGPLDLTVNNGAIKVMESIAPGKRQNREINAVKINMEVFLSGVSILQPPVQVLTRGNVFSLLVCGDKQTLNANWVKWDVRPAT